MTAATPAHGFRQNPSQQRKKHKQKSQKRTYDWGGIKVNVYEGSSLKEHGGPRADTAEARGGTFRAKTPSWMRDIKNEKASEVPERFWKDLPRGDALNVLAANEIYLAELQGKELRWKTIYGDEQVIELVFGKNKSTSASKPILGYEYTIIGTDGRPEKTFPIFRTEDPMIWIDAFASFLKSDPRWQKIQEKLNFAVESTSASDEGTVFEAPHSIVSFTRWLVTRH